MFSKNLILALLVVGALTAGTALLAGYIDGPQGAQVAADSKCAGCQYAGTSACCKIAGSCQHHEKDAAVNAAPESTCAGFGCGGCGEKKAETGSFAGVGCGGCGEKKAETPACSSAGCGGQMQGSCGAGGCCPSK
jgi:hypothetical protein